jgi:phosphotransferase system  glucose/maltose/N-acetylglucosamine-specific IIC component
VVTWRGPKQQRLQGIASIFMVAFFASLLVTHGLHHMFEMILALLWFGFYAAQIVANRRRGLTWTGRWRA